MENQKTILIVDDQEVGRTLLESILYKEDFNLLFAVDGEEAFLKAKTHKPDLVLLDVMMPKSDGYQTCQRIRSDDGIKDIPIIFVTALDDRDSRIRGFEAGANDYISKPIDRSELLARSRNLIKLHEYKHLLENRETTATTEGDDIHQKPAVNTIDKLPGKIGIKANTLFSEYARVVTGNQPRTGFKEFFYQQSGKIIGLFMQETGGSHVLSFFQDALLTKDDQFHILVNQALDDQYLILAIDRIHHQLRCFSNGISCLLFGKDKIENVSSTNEPDVTYDITDLLMIASQDQMEQLFETDILNHALNKGPDQFSNLEKLAYDLEQQLKESQIQLNLYRIG